MITRSKQFLSIDKPVTSYISELEQAFSISTPLEKLPDETRARHHEAFQKICRSYLSCPRPQFTDVLQQLYAESLKASSASIVNSTSSANAFLDAKKVEEFREKGVLPPLKLNDPELLSAVLKATDFIYEKSPFLTTSYAYLFEQSLFELACHPKLVGVAQALLGDQISFLGITGPFYKKPGAAGTLWHCASAADFGAGSQEDSEDFDIITVWISLDGSTIENGALQIIPKSFRFNKIKSEMINWKADQYDIQSIVKYYTEHIYQFSPNIISQILLRLLDKMNPQLHFYMPEIDDYRYNPGHISIDLAMHSDVALQNELRDFRVYPIEAQAGEFVVFSSLNTHSSLPNRSDRFRKAIALRYCKTGKANKSIVHNTEKTLKLYNQMFPEVSKQLANLGKSLEDFSTGSPRLLVCGDIPCGQESIYLSHEKLQESFSYKDSYFRAPNEH
jgi:ectoine hydroxylase-related dioxygenase (phytanoyl-CoA dioxygenase family)